MQSFENEQGFQFRVIDGGLGKLPIALPAIDRALEYLSIFDANHPSAAHRTPAERLELLKKCIVWAGVFSNQAGMQVLPSPDGTWACSVSAEATTLVEQYFQGELQSLRDYPVELFRPVRIFYAPEDLESDPEPVVLGTLWHEVGHALFTDFRLFYEGQRIAQDDGYLPSSWGLLANGLEDPWVNVKVSELTEVAAEQIVAMYRYHAERVSDKIKTAPLGAQFALNCPYYWFTGENLPGLDPVVATVFAQLRPHIDAYFVGDSPESNFELLKNEIWPVFKQLEDKQLQEAKKKALSKRIIRVVVAPPGQSAGSRSHGSSSADGDITIAVGSGGSGANSGDDQELQKILNELSKEERKALEEAIQKAMKEAQKNNSNNPLDHAEMNAPDYNLSEFAPNLSATLDRVAESLSTSAKKNLERSAKDIIDKAQSAALSEMLPANMKLSQNQNGNSQLSPSRGPSEEEAQKIENRIQELANSLESHLKSNWASNQSSSSNPTESEIQARVNAALREAEINSMGFEPHEARAYDRFKLLEKAMEKEAREMIRSLLPILPKKYHQAPDQWFRSGRHFEIKRMMRREPVGQIDFYERKKLVPGVDPKLFVQLIIDRSGSMFPNNMPEAIKTAIFWGKICHELAIPFSVKFFDDTYCRVKDYKQPYDGARNRVKPNMILLAEASGGGTNMGAPLSVAYQEMQEARKAYPNSMGAVFVISDAGANAGLTGESLRALIRRMQQDFLVGAFILTTQERERQLNRYYFGSENVVAPNSFSDLPRESFQILKKTIVQFAKKFS